MPVSWSLRALLAAGAVVAVLTGCRSPRVAAPTGSVHLAMGNPSGASPADPNNYLIERPQYALSYSRDRGIPNWASWQLNSDWIGELPRSQFTPDDSLPTGWYRVTPSDYTGSGYDRGHLVPSADRDRSLEDNQAVFLMSNILPQAPDNNQGPWEKLERYCRELAKEGKDLYIVAGGYGRRGAIDNGRVTVPERLWKVVVVLDGPGRTAADVTTSTRVIAVDMPNRQGIKQSKWTRYRVSVDAIEQATGYELLSNVAPEVQAVIESRVERTQP